MKYVKLFEEFNTSDVLLKLSSANGFEEFKQTAYSLSDTEKHWLLNYIKEENNKSNGLILYHGTPHFKEIKANGFKLTQGDRNIWGSIPTKVDNQGIFLSDSKNIAEYFGGNRAGEYKPFEIIKVDADIKNSLDMSAENVQKPRNIPEGIRKLGLRIMRKWDGKKGTKLNFEDIINLLDMPEFIEVIKQNGYDSVKFSENKKWSGYTYLVFDPSKLTLMKEIITMEDVYNHVCNIAIK